jgi:hypothetical protein
VTPCILEDEYQYLSLTYFLHSSLNINPLTPELNPSAQRCLPSFTGILIFKGLIARRLYKSLEVKGLKKTVPIKQ